MRMSVSTRMSATIPFVSAGNRRLRGCAEGGRQRKLRIGRHIGEVGIECPPDDLCHRHAFRCGEGVDALALLLSEVYLRPGG